MKVPATLEGKIALVAMLLGQATLLVAIALWSPYFRGLEWNTRALVGGVAITGGVLYFIGRGLQIHARGSSAKQTNGNP